MALRGQHKRITAEKVKLLPMWNPYNRKITTLEDVAGDFVRTRRQYFRGSAFEDDPVQTASLILLRDSHFIYEAKVLRSQSGEWFSLKEALGIPDLQETARQLALQHTSAALGLEQGDVDAFEQSVSAFTDGIEIANAMTYGPRVRELVEKVIERQEWDPFAYRRSSMEIRAAMIQGGNHPMGRGRRIRWSNKDGRSAEGGG